MSYTMTMDMPNKASAYVERRGLRFQSQLRSLVIAFVTAEMQQDGFEWEVEAVEKDPSTKTGASFARAWGHLIDTCVHGASNIELPPGVVENPE